VNTIAECTVPEKILLAASQLEERGQSPFTAEALIVDAWRKYPQTFGLKGFEDQHPDSNKVLASIMGEKGLARRGWLVKMGQKLYALTREGRQVVRRLLHGDDPPAAPSAPVALPREQDRLLLALLDSAAVRKFEQGRQAEWAFTEACRFWGVTENLTGEDLDACLDGVRFTLAEVERQLGLGGAVLSNGRFITGDDTGLLLDVHNALEERFARHLTLLRNRVSRH
jgi:hypothetical protein